MQQRLRVRLVVDGVLAADPVVQVRDHLAQIIVVVEFHPVAGRDHARGDAGRLDAAQRRQHAREGLDMVRQADEILFPSLQELLPVLIAVQAPHLAAGDAVGLVGLLIGDLLPYQLPDGLDQRLHPGPFRIDQRAVYVEHRQFVHLFHMLPANLRISRHPLAKKMYLGPIKRTR